MFDFVDIWNDLVKRKFFSRLRNELVLLSKVFGGKHFFGSTGLNEKATARDSGLWNSGRGCHSRSLSVQNAERSVQNAERAKQRHCSPVRARLRPRKVC